MDSYESTSQEGGIKKSPFQDLSREDLIQKCKGLLAIAQKAKKLQAETEDQAESYKVKLEKCESEQKESLINLQTLQELVDSLTEQKLNYITEVDSAKGKIKVLSDKCKKYEEDLKKINAEFKIKENHITDTTKKLSDLDTEIISLNRQYKRLVDENEQLINQLSELEAKTAEFNNIGLHQRQQLELLENKVHTDDVNRIQIETLNKRIAELESETELFWSNKIKEYESKLTDITQQYEEEKSKKEKANIKLRSYKDKILKCAACINQLKNSRFILTKTINEYSENIPKWQNDLIKASKIIDDQMVELNKENSDLKIRLQTLEEQLINISNSSSNAEIIKLNEDNSDLHKKLIELEQSYKLATEYIEEHNSTQFTELSNKCQYLQSQLKDFEIKNFRASEGNTKLLAELEIMRCEYHKLHETQLPELNEENKKLKTKLNELKHKCESLKHKNEELLKSNQLSNETNETIANLHLQIKALQSEKDNVVKEKFKARDHVVELESQNRILLGQVDKFKLELQTTKEQLDTLLQEKNALERNIKAEKENEVKNEKPKLMILQEQFDLFKKEYDLLENLNGMLKEEVDTLKLSLEQPRLEDNENVSDVNVSLQADIVKLETKLAAYKQENASLLSEIKECRAKAKEYDNLAAENEELKSKFTSYKTENTELLNEMKEINQVLKERGEAISKLQKTITEMERLVETLEKDRDNVNTVNEDLLKKVAVLESDLANAEQKTNKNCEVAEKTLIEKANALKVLKDKDTIITSLKEEIEKFKQHQTSVAELPNEDMSTSTISKAEDHSRMKDLDETFEEKYTKLRIFALKLKKKLNETVAQLQNAEQDKAKLEKILNENEKVPHSTCDEVDSSKKTEITNLEIKVKDLTASVHASEHITKELEKNKAELENKNQQLVAEIEAHKVTKENLEKARRDAKKKNVLSLEMEDYERSMKELTSKMEEKKKKMVQMESTIDTQEGIITAMKTQIKLLEEQIRAEEKQNRLTREELQHAIEDGKEKDNVIHTKNGAISKLEKDHEDEKRKNEEADLEMTALLSEKEKNLITLGEEKIELNNKVKKLEFKCAELNETLRITNIELADLKTEYTSYKVRAQAVLRQNQTVDHSQEEQLKEETAALRAQIDTLTAKLTTTQEQLSEANSEMETTRRRAAEAAGEAARAQQRTTRLHADLTRLDHQLDSERAQHKLQVSTLTQCYKTQISELEARLQKEIDVLKKQLAAEQESAKSSAGVLMLDEANHNQYMLPVIPKDDSDGEMDINVSMIPREEGEGSESAPSPPPSKPYLTSAGSGRSPVPLERLLEEGVPDDEALDAASLALTPDQEISDLKRRLQAQQQRVKHVTLLLAESERECARMSQLSELLKAELRRAHGSTHAAHNAEYMKNVTLKFLTLPPGDERGRLVPVLQKILTLTPDETNKVNAVARGLDPNPSKGWGSYLPWPGGK